MIALKVNDKDNVATLFINDVKANNEINVKDKKGNEFKVKVLNDIPYGHKVAVSEIKKGESIIKYGEVIGEATSDIKIGEWVHVHNLDSTRGRGDK